MIIDVEKVAGEGGEISGLEIVSFKDHQGQPSEVECRVEVRVEKLADSYRLQAKVKGTFSTFCHRCLEPTNFQVETGFQVLVQRADRGIPTGDDEEECLLLPLGENEVSLSSQIYENVVVSIPIRILCREDCRGLCSRCGSNLNIDPCSCPREADPRWEALRRLRGEFDL